MFVTRSFALVELFRGEAADLIAPTFEYLATGFSTAHGLTVMGWTTCGLLMAGGALVAGDLPGQPDADDGA